MQGWLFLYILIHHWLLEEALGVFTDKLSKSYTNIELNKWLPLLGCPNWKKENRHLICEMINMGIAVHYYHHPNYQSVVIPCTCYNNFHPHIDAVVRHCYWNKSHSNCYWSINHCGSCNGCGFVIHCKIFDHSGWRSCHTGTCLCGVDPCSHFYYHMFENTGWFCPPIWFHLLHCELNFILYICIGCISVLSCM